MEKIMKSHGIWKAQKSANPVIKKQAFLWAAVFQVMATFTKKGFLQWYLLKMQTKFI